MQRQSTKVPRVCQQCGASFLAIRSQVAYGRALYCSRKCLSASRVVPVVERFWSKVDTSGDCWVWTGTLLSTGYGVIHLTSTQPVGAHRFSYELAYGPISKGLCVCHTCDNPPCVRPDHLFLGTHTENMRDKMAKGRHHYMRGERVNGAKLTEDQVIEIRRRIVHGEPRHDLANEYGVSKATIVDVCSGRSWKHVKEGLNE